MREFYKDSKLPQDGMPTLFEIVVPEAGNEANTRGIDYQVLMAECLNLRIKVSDSGSK
jgi:hypothetical protein